MEQQNLKAYLDLVQQLLSCRRGEEWIVLRQNEHLVDGKLIEVMEQVANYLASEGQLNGARYLHNWAAQLHHILSQPMPSSAQPNAEDQTAAYAQLIEALLNDRRRNPQKLLAANQSLITPQLVTLMRQVAAQLQQQGDRQRAEYLDNLATEVNRSWIQTHDFQPSLEKANQLAPDPWEDPSPPPEPAPQATPATSSANRPEPEPHQPDTPPKIETTPEPVEPATQPLNLAGQLAQLNHNLAAIANTLSRLETLLTNQLKPSNPLEYLAILEQAAASGWIISSAEVEQLIGVTPQCPKGKQYFERGNWRFIKVGKIGTQTGWRVEKN